MELHDTDMNTEGKTSRNGKNLRGFGFYGRSEYCLISASFHWLLLKNWVFLLPSGYVLSQRKVVGNHRHISIIT
jgi:hypothetical protein